MTLMGTVVSDRAAWLAERKNGVGASESAAALGLSPFESPRELYLRKLGLLPEQEETEAMRWGTLLEPVIADEYERRSGEKIYVKQLMVRCPSEPLFATVDAVTEGGFPVEFKAIGQWSAKELGDEESDGLPEHWLIQAHHQMFVTGAGRCDFAVLIAGQRFRTFTVRRDAGLTDAVLEGVREFWGRVERREAPKFDGRAESAAVLRALYPECAGEVELDEVAALIVDGYEEFGRAKGHIVEGRDRSRTMILEMLGDHALGRLPDGRIITRKMIEIGETTVVRKAYSYARISIKKAREG